MVHRADIVGGSIGQTRPGNGMCRRAPNGALLENNPSPEPPPVSCSGDKSCCRPVVTAVPADHAIYPEPSDPKTLDP